MKAGWGIVLLMPLLVMAGGCHAVRGLTAKSCHDAQPYQKAQNDPPLIIPTGLDAPDTTNALRLPQLNEPAPPKRTGHAPCLDEPPPFKQPARTPQA